MNLMMALYKHCGGWWTQIIQTAWWEIFTDCPGDIAGKNLIRHSLRLGTAPTQCVERLVQYKEGSRRRRYRWCSTRRVQGAVEGGTGGAVQGGCTEQYKEVQVVQYKEGSSTFKLLLQTNRQVDRSEPGLNPSTPRSSPENEIGLLGSVWWYCVTVLLCYCVTVILGYCDTGISVFLGSHKSINIKLWWETYWSKLWIGLSRHSNKYNSESAIF